MGLIEKWGSRHLDDLGVCLPILHSVGVLSFWLCGGVEEIMRLLPKRRRHRLLAMLPRGENGLILFGTEKLLMIHGILSQLVLFVVEILVIWTVFGNRHGFVDSAPLIALAALAAVIKAIIVGRKATVTLISRLPCCPIHHAVRTLALLTIDQSALSDVDVSFLVLGLDLVTCPADPSESVGRVYARVLRHVCLGLDSTPLHRESCEARARELQALVRFCIDNASLLEAFDYLA